MVLLKVDLRFFIAAAALRSASDTFFLLTLVRYEAASFGSCMIVTFLPSGTGIIPYMFTVGSPMGDITSKGGSLTF